MSRHVLALGALIGFAAALGAPATAAPAPLGVACESPPPLHCAGPGDCALATLREPGNAVEPRTGRRFFLDYPCDLKPGETLVFILNLHGAGANGNFQRHFFAAMDLKETYRLVVATPTASGSAAIIPGAPPQRMWIPETDDAYLRNIVEEVYAGFGPGRIGAFWLAGHSQGGMTANRLVCSAGFKGRVTGWLSLSGGRIGPVQIDPGFFPPAPPGAPAPRLPGGATIGAASAPACDINYIFETGEHEIQSLPATSPWADRYGCAARVRRPDVVDDKPGYVFDTRRQGPVRPAWGGLPRPGTAEVFVYPGCRGDRLVADILRLDKGHTEGLEPRITETLVKMMVQAPAH